MRDVEGATSLQLCVYSPVGSSFLCFMHVWGEDEEPVLLALQDGFVQQRWWKSRGSVFSPRLISWEGRKVLLTWGRYQRRAGFLQNRTGPLVWCQQKQKVWASPLSVGSFPAGQIRKSAFWLQKNRPLIKHAKLSGRDVWQQQQDLMFKMFIWTTEKCIYIKIRETDQVQRLFNKNRHVFSFYWWESLLRFGLGDMAEW